MNFGSRTNAAALMTCALMTSLGWAGGPERATALILIEQMTPDGRSEAAAVDCFQPDCVREFDLPVAAAPRRYEMRAHFTDQFVHIDFYAVFPFYRPSDPGPVSGVADISLRRGFGAQEVALSWLTHGPAFDRDGVDLYGLVIAQIHITVAVRS